jgi:hypothetical protein
MQQDRLSRWSLRQTTGQRLGISQVQVSRLLARVLSHLRKRLPGAAVQQASPRSATRWPPAAGAA